MCHINSRLGAAAADEEILVGSKRRPDPQKSVLNRFTLIIEIETDDPTSASDIADSYAAQLTEHLTLWFCDRVKKAVVAKPTDRQFQGTDPNTLHAFPGEVVFALDQKG